MVNEKVEYVKVEEETIRTHYDTTASGCVDWLKKRSYYYHCKSRLLKRIMPFPGRVLEIGCGLGQNLAALEPEYGLGIDISQAMIGEAKARFPSNEYPNLEFEQMSALDCNRIDGKFDHIILVNSMGEIPDIGHLFRQLRGLCTRSTRIILLNFNYLLSPIIRLAEHLRVAPSHPPQNWITRVDLDNIALLAGYENVRNGYNVVVPFRIPLLSNLINRLVPTIPLLQQISLLYYSVYRVRLDLGSIEDFSVSVCVPCKNEEGNIDDVVKRIPDMGKSTEIIFVDDKSTDKTAEKVREHIEANPNRTIKLVEGPGEGKGGACRSGFAVAENDILMILDADMTTMPEELPDFFEAIASGKGEFINGSRLVYPMEKAAMRYLNIIGNRAFALLFSYLLSQRIKDTLCGTKVIWRSDYPKILESREHFGCSDRWGDYDWIFGAARYNLKIVELAVHYRERVAGETKMTKRFSNGWTMLRMCRIAYWRMKVL